MLNSFNEIIENRRSFYDISSDMVVSKERVIEIVEHSIKYAPSAFNSQSSRAVILFGDDHRKLWQIAKDILKNILQPEIFELTDKKLSSFQTGAGTVMFFEDQTIIENLQKQFVSFKDNFPLWSLQSSGMAQYLTWISLEKEGFGASLQHYNPLIDSRIKSVWKIPEKWRLNSEMVFGKPISKPAAKEFQPIENRVIHFG